MTGKKTTKKPKKDKILFDGKKDTPNGGKTAKNRETEPKNPNISEIKPTEVNNPPENLPETPQNSPNGTELIEYDTKIEKLFNDIDLPEAISPVKGKQSKYTPQRAVNILVNIATDGSRTIERIANDCGIDGKTVHLWALYSDMFLLGYHRAQEMRQDAKIRDIERLETELDTYIDNNENDVREKNIRIQRYRTRTMTRFWEASRTSARYQEKTQQDTNVTVNQADLRAQAWEQVHNAPKEIPHEEVPTDTQAPNNEQQANT